VSPKYSDLGVCFREISTIFAALSRRFVILNETTAATHVHVSRKNAAFSLPDVRLLAKGALCLSRPLCDLVLRPKGWSVPNLEDPTSLPDLLEDIDDETNVKDVVELACETRYRAFNLRRLVDSSYSNSARTIEVRRMHGSMNAEDAKHWITMALSTVHLMLEQELDTIPSPGNFKDRIDEAAVKLGMESSLQRERLVRDA
jgi:hypothetical protein